MIRTIYKSKAKVDFIALSKYVQYDMVIMEVGRSLAKTQKLACFDYVVLGINHLSSACPSCVFVFIK